MKPKSFLAVAIVIFISSCAKQEIVSKKITSQGNVSNLIDGPCPYPCTDTRCQAYVNDYCGGGGGTIIWRTPNVKNSIASVTDKNALLQAFNNLQANGVNLQELSIELGLSYTIKADSIDFANTQLSYDANNPGANAVVANFKSNSRNYNAVGFAFVIYTDSSLYAKPTIVKLLKDQYFKYFDLTEGLITTANNYSSFAVTFSSTYGSFISSPAARQQQLQKLAGCGQASMNCFIDAYSNHGFASLWISVQSAFIPQTVAAIAGECIARNCFGLHVLTFQALINKKTCI